MSSNENNITIQNDQGGNTPEPGSRETGEVSVLAVPESSSADKDVGVSGNQPLTIGSVGLRLGSEPRESVNSVTRRHDLTEGSEQRVSGNNVERQHSSEGADDTVRFLRRRLSLSERQYRRRTDNDSSDDEPMPQDARDSSSDPDHPGGNWADVLSVSSSSESGHSSYLLDEHRSQFLEENSAVPKALLKSKPIHKWFAVKEIVNREAGCSPRLQGSDRFLHRYYGSLHAVQRLELMYKLEHHRGCVNSLHFNRSGEYLISASDDKRVVLWNWAIDKPILSYDSGHTGNVFQAKFLPLTGDRHIVTCGRDGQVRLSVLSGVGVCKGTRLLAQHRRTTHKLAIHSDTPHVFLSAGEDAVVLSHDVRTSKAHKVLVVKEGNNKVGLYSVHSNPMYSNEFIVTGEDHFIRLYDRRKVNTQIDPVKKFCPKHLLSPAVYLHVTCAVYNYNGSEVIGSYNDDDIYLFDTRLPDDADYVHKYEGHRNSVTVKGVNFFGPKSEFIVSGSDCGNIYFWDKGTEAIVQWMRGDEEGVVNCLEPHPQVPIIATSGLDSDIKIWVPSFEKEPTLEGLKSTVINNQSERSHSIGQRSDPFDNRQMRWLWRQIQHFENRRTNNNALEASLASDGPVSDASVEMSSQQRSDSSSSEEDTNSARPQCSPS